MSIVVVFAHPVAEQTRNLGWNEPIPVGRHRHGRTFVNVKGRSSELNGETNDVTLTAWVEWEHYARADLLSPAIEKHHAPTRVAYPFLGPTRRQVHNTDPVVFDGPFVYNLCRQGRYPLLRTLESGDLILFGGRSSEGFLLDTVFVVGSRSEYLHSAAVADETVRRVSVEPLCDPLNVQDVRDKFSSNHDHTGLNLSQFGWYTGATPATAVNGMFSFVPALAHHGKPEGFQRPVITGIHGIGNPMAVQYLTEQPVEVWKTILKYIRDAGLVPATSLRTWTSEELGRR
jgi:hypothetical protein